MRAANDGECRGARRILGGIQLFNHGYYWEAHEAWEQVWHACGRNGVAADYLKGLIKLAAAGVKTRQGIPEGVARHASRAAELFRQVQSTLPVESDAPFGLLLDSLLQAAENIAAHGSELMNTDNAPVVITLPAL